VAGIPPFWRDLLRQKSSERSKVIDYNERERAYTFSGLYSGFKLGDDL
jgi:hypothetical protein